MTDSKVNVGFFNPIMIGFLAGFISTVTFHQAALWVLWRMGMAANAPYAMSAVPPFGVPAILSLAFWGGVWGIIFALVHRNFPRTGYWITAFLFGAVLPSLVALFIVAPLKGRPVAGGWELAVLMTAFLINGMWGLGTAVFLKLLRSGFGFRKVQCPPGAVCDY